MIDSTFFGANRRKIIDIIADSLIVLTAYSEMQRCNDEAFGFKQEANFWWLTGIDQSDWLLIIDSQSDKQYLVSPVISDRHQLFNGNLLFDDAKAISGVDNVLSYDEAINMLVELAKKYDAVYTLIEPKDTGHLNFSLNPAQQKLHM